MVTLSRLEPNKHIMFIAESLAILKDRGFNIPPWMIIGYGSQEQVQRLRCFCEENAIVYCLQPCFGVEKWLCVKMAKLMLCGLMMWIPISEGIVCQTPVLAIDDQEVHDMYEDTIWWAERNNPEDYADKIELLLDPVCQKSIEGKNAYALDRLLDRDRHGKAELYANTQERAAWQYENIFMVGVK